jgi:hypothetical protein
MNIKKQGTLYLPFGGVTYDGPSATPTPGVRNLNSLGNNLPNSNLCSQP